MVTSVILNVLTAVFPKKIDLTSNRVCDTLRTEVNLYQTKKIPETDYQPTVEPKVSSRKKVLIGKKAFHLAGLYDATKEPPICDMEKFVLYLQNWPSG